MKTESSRLSEENHDMRTKIYAVLAIALLTVPALATESLNVSTNVWRCSLDAVDGTLTKCKTAPPEGKLQVTRILAQSTTTTGGQFTLRYGTGTNCGTGTTSILPEAATAARYGAPASTASANVLTFGDNELVIPTGNDLCVLGVATNTVTIQVYGVVR